MKKYILLFLLVLLFSCKHDKNSATKEDLLKYDMVSVIEKGNTKVIVGSKPAHAVEGQVSTFGVFPEGRTVMLSPYEIGKFLQLPAKMQKIVILVMIYILQQ